MLTRYFPPDIGTSANLFFDLACSLKKNGHDVAVVTGYPWYNLSSVPLQFRKGIFKREVTFGVKVVRVRLPLFRSKKLALAAGHFLSPIALLLGGLRSPKSDVIYVYSPPLLMGLTGRLIAWRMKAIFVLGVQDLHPQAYIDQGILRNRILINIFRSIEKLMYRLSDSITVHSQGNLDYVLGVVPSKNKVVKVVSNWVNSDQVSPLPRFNSFSRELFLDDKFVVGYAGTIGISQGTECIIEAAFSLRGKSDIHFLVVGDGVEKEGLLRKVRDKDLTNISFIEMQPQEKYPNVVATFDLALVTLNPMVKTPVIPSKIISIMAAERPLIASLPEGDAAALVRLADCGLVIPPADSNELREAIVQLYENKKLRERFGRNGRNYVQANLTSDKAASILHEIFESTINDSSSSAE